MYQLAGTIGRKTLISINHLLNLFAFIYRMLGLLFRPPTTGKAIVRRITLEQLYFTAVQALPIIVPAALIIGSMLIIQFTKFQGQYDLGKITVLLIMREIGPVVTALLVILRSATAVTIETGYMKVLHEVDALEMAGLDPLWVVCLPRLIGITTAILSLFIVFDLVAILGGYAVVWIISYIPMGNFLQQIAKAITVADIVVGIIKATCFGIAITATCLHHGFGIRKLITGIPVATSRASVESFFFCLVINVIISILFYI